MVDGGEDLAPGLVHPTDHTDIARVQPEEDLPLSGHQAGGQAVILTAIKHLEEGGGEEGGGDDGGGEQVGGKEGVWVR